MGNCAAQNVVSFPFISFLDLQKYCNIGLLGATPNRNFIDFSKKSEFHCGNGNPSESFFRGHGGSSEKTNWKLKNLERLWAVCCIDEQAPDRARNCMRTFMRTFITRVMHNL